MSRELTAEQLAQLRGVAERATCGRWELSFPCDSDGATIDREVEGFIPICVVEGAHPDGGYDEYFQSEQQANAEFIAAFHPALALALLDELERKDALIAELEEKNAEILRQARSFREAHDSAAEIIRRMERSKPVVTLPATRLWAGKVPCFEEKEIVSLLVAAGINLTVED